MAKMKDGSPGFVLRLLKAMGANVMVKALSGAAILWQFLPEDGTCASFIHQTFCSECWVEGGEVGSLILVLGFVCWAPMLLGTVVYNSFRCGPRVRRQQGKTVLRQVREQLGLAIRYAVPSHWYYIFEFHNDQYRSHAREYLYRFETKTGLYHMFRDYLSSPETTMALSDKTLFAVRCEQHAVPVVSALAKAVAGEIVQLDGTPGSLPKQSFFLKANRGAGGRSASRWRYEPQDGKYYDSDGNAFSGAELSAHVKRLSLSEDYVLRMLAVNHSGLSDLNLGALNTVRVLTIMNESGEAEVTHAVLRMASSANVVVDNFHAGGIAAKIDLQSGRLGQASNMGLTADSQWWDAHPVTGGQILDRVLPYWNEVKALACKAHGAFADQVAIGWDIAVLDDGPRLVEGNKGPDLDIIQRIYREPVGNGRFGELMAYHIRRVLETKRAAVA